MRVVGLRRVITRLRLVELVSRCKRVRLDGDAAGARDHLASDTNGAAGQRDGAAWNDGQHRIVLHRNCPAKFTEILPNDASVRAEASSSVSATRFSGSTVST